MSLMKWELPYGQRSIDMLGYIRFFLYEDDPRSAREQFTDRYAMGGWHPFPGFQLIGVSIQYPGDPALYPIAHGVLHDKEKIFVYPHAWVMILQPDDTYEISRMD